MPYKYRAGSQINVTARIAVPLFASRTHYRYWIEGDENDLVKGHRGQYLRMKQETETERQRQNEFVKYLLSL